MGGGGNRVKSRKNSVTDLTPSHFMMLYLNRYHMTETVFMYTHRLRHDTVFQCVHVVPDQPLHRWFVVSSFHVCRIVSPKFQQGDIEIYKFCR